MRIVSIVVSLIGTSLLCAQPPVRPMPPTPSGGALQISELMRSREPGGGGNRMTGMIGGDPMIMFNMLARGKDSINRNDLEDWQQRMFDRIAPTLGITNGVMTRDQFRQAADTMRQRMQSGGGMGGLGGAMNAEQMARFGDERFRRADVNGDGLLQVNEMSERLRPVWEKFDLNKDGAVDLNEYKSYMQSAFQQEQPNGQPVPGQPAIMIQEGQPPVPIVPEDEERKPTVYRAGKLPKDIPAWFDQLDTDKDGQVGLYEWVKGEKSIDEFRPIDRNDDGFATIDEVMLTVAKAAKPTGSPGEAVAANAMMPGGFNLFGGGGRNTMRFGGSTGDEARGNFGRGPGGGGQNGERGPRMRGPNQRGGENGNGFGRPRGEFGGPNRRPPDAATPPAGGSGNSRGPRGNYRDPYSDPTLP